MLSWLEAVLVLGLAAASAGFLMSQVRRPSRWVGRLFLWNMNRSHAALTDWALKDIDAGAGAAILDVGCGGGRTVQKLAARLPDGVVYGVDHSSESVAVARIINGGLIDAGRVDIKQASVSRLPFPDDTFNLVTAVETQYYWPKPADDMREVLRVLKPGGRLVVVAETYRGGRFNWIEGPVMTLIGSSSLSLDDQRSLFLRAGYIDVEVLAEPDKGWMRASGRKPID